MSLPIKRVYGKRKFAPTKLKIFEDHEKQLFSQEIDVISKQISTLQVFDVVGLNGNDKENVVYKTDSAYISPAKSIVEKEDSKDKLSNKSFIDLALPSTNILQPQKNELVHEPNTTRDIRETQSEQIETSYQAQCGAKQQFPIALPAKISINTLTHLSPLLEYNPNIYTFSSFTESMTATYSIMKIAEASYSQVFILKPKSETTLIQNKSPPVLKLIPLLPSGKIDKKSSLHDTHSQPINVASELALLSQMRSVPGFTDYRDLYILSGSPVDTSFARAAKEWDENEKLNGKEGTYVDYMEKSSKKQTKKKSTTRTKTSGQEDGVEIPEEELWAVIEMDNAGMDLERLIELPSIFKDEDQIDTTSPQHIWHALGVFAIWDIFWQVALAVAKGEISAQFESRDLHCGNICVRMDKQISILTSRQDSLPIQCRAMMRDRLTRKDRKGRSSLSRKYIGVTGMEATVIDYTISRANLSCQHGEDCNREECSTLNNVAYIDLGKEAALFEGDSSDEYQYDIYRYLRAVVFCNDPLADIENVEKSIATGQKSWKDFHPRTNLVWLHFILYKLLENYTPIDREIQNEESVTDVLSDREREVDQNLYSLRDKLSLERWTESGLSSAADLINHAFEQKWLSDSEIKTPISEMIRRQQKHQRVINHLDKTVK